jgi:hypothetical protein
VDIAEKQPVTAELSLVEIMTRDDQVVTVRLADGRGLVPLKRVCQWLGVDVEGQRRKLRKTHWCRLVDMSAPDERGRPQRITMIDRATLPMWLAGINTVNVRDEIKPRLIAFQCEARDVLAEHFFGTTSPTLADLARPRDVCPSETAVQEFRACLHLAQMFGLSGDEAVRSAGHAFAVRYGAAALASLETAGLVPLGILAEIR